MFSERGQGNITSGSKPADQRKSVNPRQNGVNATSKSKGFKIGRDNDTGRLKSVEQAKASPRGSSVEVMPKKGNGDTGRYDNKKK